MSTSWFCIDLRAAEDFPTSGFISEALVEQLGEAPGYELPVAVLMRESQTAPEPARKIYADFRTGNSLIYSAWEKELFKNASVGGLHRFRPLNRLGAEFAFPTLTTVLPRKGRDPWFRSRRHEHFTVSSHADARHLGEILKIAPEQISVVVPTVRQSLITGNEPVRCVPRTLLLLTGDFPEKFSLKRFGKILAQRYPNLPQKVLSLDEASAFTSVRWKKQLENVHTCFYLTTRPFDWPVVALESLYWKIPTVFMDGHRALNEMAGFSDLRLSRYLVEKSSDEGMRQATEATHQRLAEKGAFDPATLKARFEEVVRLHLQLRSRQQTVLSSNPVPNVAIDQPGSLQRDSSGESP